MKPRKRISVQREAGILKSGLLGSWKRSVWTSRESSGLPFCLSQTGDSTMKLLRHNCTTEATEENKKTNLHRVGVAIRKPSTWVIMIPSTMASCVRTPDSANEVSYVDGTRHPTDTTPYIRWGDFSKENRPCTQTDTGSTARKKPIG